MKCPHCLENFHENEQPLGTVKDIEGYWEITQTHCPACKRCILSLAHYDAVQDIVHGSGQKVWGKGKLKEKCLIRPKGANRPPPPPEVPKKFVNDYQEACLVLPDSAQASAALSRRCLQHILREVAKVKAGNLATEIDEVLKTGHLPNHIAESIHAIRNVGNFAAHPMKDQSTGQIVPVEAGEAEWNLDVLESLFDFYFVQPEATKRRKAALNAKLTAAGKPAIK